MFAHWKMGASLRTSSMEHWLMPHALVAALGCASRTSYSETWLLSASRLPPGRLAHWTGPPGALLSTQGVQSLHRPTLMIAIDAELIVVHDGTGHDDDMNHKKGVHVHTHL